LLVPLLTVAPGNTVRARIPAREVILARPSGIEIADAISLHNIVHGTVRAVAEDPARQAMLVEIALAGDVPGPALLSRVTPDAVLRLGLVPGAPVLALIKSMSVEVLGDGVVAQKH
jgi:molybdate transport system ATP-binding protein